MAATSGEIARLRDHDASGCRRPLFVCRSWAGPGATPIVARGARLRAARFGPTRGWRSSAGAWKRDSSKERVEGTPRRNGGSGAVVLSCCRAVVLSCCRAVVLSCCRVIARLLDCSIAWSGVRVGVRSRVRVFVCSCVRVFVRRHGRVCAERSFDRAARGERRAVKGEGRRAKGEGRARAERPRRASREVGVRAAVRRGLSRIHRPCPRRDRVQIPAIPPEPHDADERHERQQREEQRERQPFSAIALRDHRADERRGAARD